jgi:hypothetical protein
LLFTEDGIGKFNWADMLAHWLFLYFSEKWISRWIFWICGLFSWGLEWLELTLLALLRVEGKLVLFKVRALNLLTLALDWF